METLDKLKETIRDVHDFPKPGIIFKDITPIFQNSELTSKTIKLLQDQVSHLNIEGIAGIESRGFLLGLPLAIALNVPFILIRKKGKLPADTTSIKYDLEYGTAEIEIHTDAINPGQNILIHDDLLATGGSAKAAAQLIEKLNGNVVGFNFLVALDFLDGKNALTAYSKEISSLINY